MEPEESRHQHQTNGGTPAADPYANPFEEQQSSYNPDPRYEPNGDPYEQQQSAYDPDPRSYDDPYDDPPPNGASYHDDPESASQHQPPPKPYSDDPNNSNNNNPYINGEQQPYLDDPNATAVLGEPEAPKQSKKSRIKKYCAGCYFPTCDFRGPWCVYLLYLCI